MFSIIKVLSTFFIQDIRIYLALKYVFKSKLLHNVLCLIFLKATWVEIKDAVVKTVQVQWFYSEYEKQDEKALFN